MNKTFRIYDVYIDVVNYAGIEVELDPTNAIVAARSIGSGVCAPPRGDKFLELVAMFKVHEPEKFDPKSNFSDPRIRRTS